LSSSWTDAWVQALVGVHAFWSARNTVDLALEASFASESHARIGRSRSVAVVTTDVVVAKLAELALVQVKLALVKIDTTLWTTFHDLAASGVGVLFLSISSESLLAFASVSDLVVGDVALGQVVALVLASLARMSNIWIGSTRVASRGVVTVFAFSFAVVHSELALVNILASLRSVVSESKISSAVLEVSISIPSDIAEAVVSGLGVVSWEALSVSVADNSVTSSERIVAWLTAVAADSVDALLAVGADVHEWEDTLVDINAADSILVEKASWAGAESRSEISSESALSTDTNADEAVGVGWIAKSIWIWIRSISALVGALGIDAVFASSAGRSKTLIDVDASLSRSIKLETGEAVAGVVGLGGINNAGTELAALVSTSIADGKWIWRVVADVAAGSVHADGVNNGSAIEGVESTFIVIDTASEWTASVESSITDADEGFSVVGVIWRASTVEEASSGSGSSWSTNSVWISISTASSTAIRVDTISGKWISTVWADESSSRTLVNISASEVGVLCVSGATVASEHALVNWVNRARRWSNARVGASAKTERIAVSGARVAAVIIDADGTSNAVANGWGDLAFINVDAVVESEIGDVAVLALANWRHKVFRWSTVGVDNAGDVADVKWISLSCADESADLVDTVLSSGTWCDVSSALINIDAFESLEIHSRDASRFLSRAFHLTGGAWSAFPFWIWLSSADESSTKVGVDTELLSSASVSSFETLIDILAREARVDVWVGNALLSRLASRSGALVKWIVLSAA
jgi:hypothetical protein